MHPPADHSVLLHGNASFMRELRIHLAESGVRAVTGPLPSSG